MPTTKSRSKKRSPCYVEFDALSYRTAQLDLKMRGGAENMGGHPRKWRLEITVRSWSLKDDEEVQVDQSVLTPDQLLYLTALAPWIMKAIQDDRDHYQERILSVKVKAHIIR